jgi:predicted transcriptional regulator
MIRDLVEFYAEKGLYLCEIHALVNAPKSTVSKYFSQYAGSHPVKKMRKAPTAEMIKDRRKELKKLNILTEHEIIKVTPMSGRYPAEQSKEKEEIERTINWLKLEDINLKDCLKHANPNPYINMGGLRT